MGGCVMAELKQVILEMGTGNDLYGEDYTKAAKRAIEDAVRHSSLPLFAVTGLSHEDMRVQVTVGVQEPDSVFAFGDIHHWKNYREVPDQVTAMETQQVATRARSRSSSAFFRFLDAIRLPTDQCQLNSRARNR